MSYFRLAIPLTLVLIAASCATKPEKAAIPEAPAILVEDDFHVAIDLLRDELALTDEQTRLAREAVIERSADLREVINASHEHEPSPEEMISLLAQSRTEFQADLKVILTDDQWAIYLEHQDVLREAIMTAAAARRVAVMDNPLGLTEEQSRQMAAVIGRSTAKLIIVLQRFAGQRLGMMQKMELGRSFISIRAENDKQLAQILTTEQMARYKQLRKEMADH